MLLRRWASTKATQSAMHFTMDQAGLVTDLYVPPKNLPSWFAHPALRWKALKRRIQMVGVNTYMAIRLRREIGKERFRPFEWKETALMLYQRTNECFVERDLKGLAKLTSRWVYGPLSMRAQKLPKNEQFGWKLLKYNSRPRVISMVPLSLGEGPTRYVQVVYGIESTQALSKLRRGEKEARKIERDVSDNMAFIFDTTKSPVQGRLIGSLFETPINAPLPDPMNTPNKRTEIMKAMSLRGDVFRSPPEYLVVKE